MPGKINQRIGLFESGDIYTLLERILEEHPVKRVFEALELSIEERVRVSLRLNNLEMATFWQKCLKDAEKLRKRAEKL